MAEVTFPAEYGGDGNTYSDDADPNTGLDGVGYMTRFVPCLQGAVAMAAFSKGQADAAQQFAETCQTLRDQAVQAKESASSSANKAAANKQATDEALAEAESRIGSSQALAEARDTAQQNAIATGQDRQAVAADRQQTNADRTATSAAAEATAADRQQTGEDRQATAAAAASAAADRQQTGEDRAATAAAAEATAADRQQTGADRQATAADREAAQSSAASVDADQIMHAPGSGLPNEVGTAATRNVGTGAGNLMEVGAFGVGSKGIDPNYPLPSFLDDARSVPAGSYSFGNQTTGGPLSAGGTVRISHPSIETVLFEISYWYSSLVSRTFKMTQKNGESGVWIPVYDGFNVVGNVSDTDGVPTGALIEVGENANGRYMKYLDGTVTMTMGVTFPLVGGNESFILPTSLVPSVHNRISVTTNTATSGWEEYGDRFRWLANGRLANDARSINILGVDGRINGATPFLGTFGTADIIIIGRFK